ERMRGGEEGGHDHVGKHDDVAERQDRIGPDFARRQRWSGFASHDSNSCCCAIPPKPASAQQRQDALTRAGGAVAPANTTAFPGIIRTPAVLPILGGPPPRGCQVSLGNTVKRPPHKAWRLQQ